MTPPPQVEAFLEMMAVERDASPHTLSAYARDLADAQAFLSDRGGLMAADAPALEAWFAGFAASNLTDALGDLRHREFLPNPPKGLRAARTARKEQLQA